MKPTSISKNDILTAQELAALLRVSDDTIYEYVRRGQIPCRKVGNQLRFPAWLIIDWLDTAGRKEGA